jgi:hypothetical protein
VKVKPAYVNVKATDVKVKPANPKAAYDRQPMYKTCRELRNGVISGPSPNQILWTQNHFEPDEGMNVAVFTMPPL